eukprot:GHVT01100879.1.p1 GENE.GHVT01100879.1~~GHVT01100879.1.p1  ORF type:complete len:604 (-),score=139.84 GHVT01100879.1:129-1757(-)
MTMAEAPLEGAGAASPCQSPTALGLSQGVGAPPVEIKLFVGRVPKTYEEDELRPIFEAFGVVGDVIIIRDRETGAHKGCAFVRMTSLSKADNAIRELNNLKTLDASLGPLQVKYAAGEAERLGLPVDGAGPGVDQAKLFVGSLPKNATEELIRSVFEKFGLIDEIFIMKDDNRTNKAGRSGCAFVKYTYKEEALHAIANLNGRFTMPGATRAVEVRFAETKNRYQQGPASNGSMAGATASLALSAVNSSGAGGAAGGGGATGRMLANEDSGSYAALSKTSVSVAAANRVGQISQNWTEYFTTDGRPYYYNSLSGVTQWEKPPEMRNAAVSVAGGISPAALGSQTHGPPGANVFIFHIPNEWTERDMLTHFAVFGHVVSARIATDRETGRNRGFGFISYTTVASAVAAVSAMNGYQVNGKRLKVQIKKGEEQYCDTFSAANDPADPFCLSVGERSAAGNSRASPTSTSGIKYVDNSEFSGFVDAYRGADLSAFMGGGYMNKGGMSATHRGVEGITHMPNYPATSYGAHDSHLQHYDPRLMVDL